MRLELTGRHVDISPAIRRVVDRKLAKLERLLDHRALSAQVVLTQGKRLLRADVTLHARGEKFLHAVGEASAWESAMTQATGKIAQQAQTLKGKWQERKRQGRGAPDDAVDQTGRADLAGTDRPSAQRPALPAATPRIRMPRIVRTTRQVVRPLSLSQAARQLDGDSDLIVVFRDKETEGVSVLYRSSGGELVLVQTQG